MEMFVSGVLKYLVEQVDVIIPLAALVGFQVVKKTKN